MKSGKIEAPVNVTTQSQGDNSTKPASTAYVDTGLGNKLLGDGTVNPTNLLSNGSFESWSAGTSVAPDGWTFAESGGGSTASIAREGTTKKTGSYSAKLTRNGHDCWLRQDASTDTYIQGRTYTWGCWVYATVANRARLQLYDGTDSYYSSYHTGNSTWQFLTITQTISVSSTTLSVLHRLDTGDTSAYFDGTMLVEGASAFAYSDAPDGVWADYGGVSTIVGWSSFITKKIYTKKVGKTVFVSYILDGTSNSANTSFTVPYTSAVEVVTSPPSLIYDAGSAVFTVAEVDIPASSAVVSFYYPSGSGNWTASARKIIAGQFFYQST